MAVTQQLARMDEQALDACARDRAAFASLLSFRLEAATYLDLDWAPRGLCAGLSELGEPDVVARLALLLSGDGAQVVSAAWPEGIPEDPVYSPVTWTAPSDLEWLAGALCDVDSEELGRHAAQGADEGSPPYFAEHFRALQRFLVAARERRQCVVAWWD